MLIGDIQMLLLWHYHK